MARILSSKKRKRDSVSEEHDFDCDTIAVVSRAAVAVSVSGAHLPLRETPSQANVTRKRTTSRTEGKCRNISLTLTRLLMKYTSYRSTIAFHYADFSSTHSLSEQCT